MRGKKRDGQQRKRRRKEMMGKDERECVKLPFGEYLKVPDDK